MMIKGNAAMVRMFVDVAVCIEDDGNDGSDH